MKAPLFFSRTLALFLSFVLSMPSPVLALRNLEPVEAGLESDLEKSLTAGLEELPKGVEGWIGQLGDPAVGAEAFDRLSAEVSRLSWQERHELIKSLLLLRFEEPSRLVRVLDLLRQIHKADPEDEVRQLAAKALRDIEPLFEPAQVIWDPASKGDEFRAAVKELNRQWRLPCEMFGNDKWAHYSWVLQQSLIRMAALEQPQRVDELARYPLMAFSEWRRRLDSAGSSFSALPVDRFQYEAQRLSWLAVLKQIQNHGIDVAALPNVAALAKILEVPLPLSQAGLEEGVLFDGLTTVRPDGTVQVATDLLPDRVVLSGLQEGRRRLVLSAADQQMTGRIFLGPGIQLDPAVRRMIGEERIFALPADPAEARAGLEQQQAGVRDLVLLDVSHGSEKNWVSGSQGVPIINLPSILAAQLSALQLAGLEEAARRQPGGILRVNGILQRDWKEPLDVYDLAA